MNNTNSKQNGKFIIALSHCLQNIHRKSEQLFHKNNLTMSQFTVLEALYHKGNLTIGQIIRAVLSSSGNITVVIKNLEFRGLVCRLDNPNDKRSFLIQITDAGKDMFKPIFSKHMDFVAEALSSITPEEKEQVMGILIKTTKKQ